MIATDLHDEGAEVVNADGKMITPGGIDVHTHLDLPFFDTVSSDDFYTGHKAAAFGGTTTHIDFAIQRKGESLHQAINNWHKKADHKAAINYGFHVAITDLTEEVMEEIPTIASEGISSLKLFMAYKGLYQVDDSALLKTLMKAAEAGLTTMVHAENGDVLDILIKDNVDNGRLATEYHARSHPAWAEAEATMRAVALAGIAQAPLYVVHMTCQESVDQLRYGRDRGLPVMGETCTHYLFFTVDKLSQQDGSKYVCSPPVRTKKDNEYLWKALADGHLQAVSTDHCPFMYNGTQVIEYEGEHYQMAGKELGLGNFAKIPNGMHGIEDRMLVLWTYGVGQGRISANKYVELTATNPAKIFGMYPRKGTVTVGADADLVIWDTEATKNISWRNMHMRTDHNVYEGWNLRGLPEKVYVHGKRVVNGETWEGKPGSGCFVHRTTHSEII